jgi:hypothetical protein
MVIYTGNGYDIVKSSRIGLYLFGKPAWELDGLESQEIKQSFADQLERLGDELRNRLRESARVLRLLIGKGWSAYGGLYDIDFVKDLPKEDAAAEVKELGLDLDVEEEEYEKEEDEEGDAHA